MRLLIFHTGSIGTEFYKKFFEMIDRLDYDLIGFTSKDAENNFKLIGDYTVYPAESVVMLKYDKILVGEINEEVIESYKEIFLNLNVPAEKISGILWLLQQIMIKKYEDIPDPAIQETLAYWKNHELSVFNQHTAGYKTTYDEVFFDDKIDLPYINFKTIEGKTRRMYYPKNQNFYQSDNGKKYVKDILDEQVPTSPHLYVTENHNVEEGDVLIDAGVCEGNFVLRYADICSKIYLFEPDEKWFEPLYYSLRDCWEKVEFIPKGVGEASRGGVITLDDAINLPSGSKIFLKMDIEGAEPAALRGAKKFLTMNKVKASICSYHNADDIIKIKSIMQNYGYKTSTSAGYMIFMYDPKIFEKADFRKGIVYATNY